MVKPNYTRAKTEAAKLLSKYGYDKPPIDPEYIAEGEGVDVVYVNFDGQISNEISGFYDFTEARIYINRVIAPVRMTWTIAHELGHHLLHQDYARSEEYTFMPRNNGYEGVKPPEEKEADAFAAALLVPPHMLKKYARIADNGELSRMFAVSREAIAYRKKSLRYT